MKVKNLIPKLVGTVVSLGLLYVTVYYGGKAWKRSQTGEKLY